jgi:hypothetical protein
MTITYKEIIDFSTNKPSKTQILRSDGWTVPFDPANTDYQAYLKWVSEGGVPTPAEEAL